MRKGTPKTLGFLKRFSVEPKTFSPVLHVETERASWTPSNVAAEFRKLKEDTVVRMHPILKGIFRLPEPERVLIDILHQN